MKIDMWIIIAFWIAFVSMAYYLVIMATNYSTLSNALKEFVLEEELTAEEDEE